MEEDVVVHDEIHNELNVAIGDKVLLRTDDVDGSIIAIEDLGEIRELGFKNDNGYRIDFKVLGDLMDKEKTFSPVGDKIAVIPPKSEWPEQMCKLIRAQKKEIKDLLIVVRGCGNNGVGKRFKIARIDTLERLEFAIHSVESGDLPFSTEIYDGFYESNASLDESYTVYRVGADEIVFPEDLFPELER